VDKPDVSVLEVEFSSALPTETLGLLTRTTLAQTHYLQVDWVLQNLNSGPELVLQKDIAPRVVPEEAPVETVKQVDIPPYPRERPPVSVWARGFIFPALVELVDAIRVVSLLSTDWIHSGENVCVRMLDHPVLGFCNLPILFKVDFHGFRGVLHPLSESLDWVWLLHIDSHPVVECYGEVAPFV